MENQTPEEAAKKERQQKWAMLPLVWEVGYIMAIPAVAFGFGGAYLDKYLGTSPVFVILGLSLALTASTLTLWRIIKRTL